MGRGRDTNLRQTELERGGLKMTQRDSTVPCRSFPKAHNVSDHVRESEFISLEEKFLPVCAGLAHCKDRWVDCLRVICTRRQQDVSIGPLLGHAGQGEAFGY